MLAHTKREISCSWATQYRLQAMFTVPSPTFHTHVVVAGRVCTVFEEFPCFHVRRPRVCLLLFVAFRLFV